MVKRKCVRGWACGNSCITRKKKCRSNLNEEGRKLIETFSQYIVRLGSNLTDENAETLGRLSPEATITRQNTRNFRGDSSIPENPNQLDANSLTNLLEETMGDKSLLERLEEQERITNLPLEQRNLAIADLEKAKEKKDPEGTINRLSSEELNQRLNELGSENSRFPAIERIKLKRREELEEGQVPGVIATAEAIAKLDGTNVQNIQNLPERPDPTLQEAIRLNTRENGVFGRTDNDRERQIQDSLKERLVADQKERNKTLELPVLSAEENEIANKDLTNLENEISQAAFGGRARLSTSRAGAAGTRKLNSEMKKALKTAILSGTIPDPRFLTTYTPDLNNKEKAAFLKNLQQAENITSILDEGESSSQNTAKNKELIINALGL